MAVGSRTVLGIGPGPCSLVFSFSFFLEPEANFHRSGSADQSSDGKVKVAVREVLGNVG